MVKPKNIFETKLGNKMMTMDSPPAIPKSLDFRPTNPQTFPHRQSKRNLRLRGKKTGKLHGTTK